MKFVAIALVSLFSVMAHAIPTGLRCSLEYTQNSNVLGTLSARSEGVVSNGQVLKGEALTTDGDGQMGTNPAHSLKAKKVTIDKQSYWQVTVLNAEQTKIGIYTFLEEAGVKVSFPTNAIQNESEDPITFDTLNVICDYTVFAG